MEELVKVPIRVQADEVTIKKVFHSGFGQYMIPLAAPVTVHAGTTILIGFRTGPDGSMSASVITDAESTEIRGELPPAS